MKNIPWKCGEEALLFLQGDIHDEDNVKRQKTDFANLELFPERNNESRQTIIKIEGEITFFFF